MEPEYSCTYIHTYLHTHTHIYIYIHTYVHTYIHSIDPCGCHQMFALGATFFPYLDPYCSRTFYFCKFNIILPSTFWSSKAWCKISWHEFLIVSSLVAHHPSPKLEDHPLSAAISCPQHSDITRRLLQCDILPCENLTLHLQRMTC